MADITGTIRAVHGGSTYDLRCTMGVLAKLQGIHGPSVGGLLDGSAGDLPEFQPMIDMVSLSLQKASGLPADQADEIADDLITEDQGIVERLLTAAFPEAASEAPASGNRKRPKRAA
ncbi:hypothetical protein [Roseicitreum antarcticum]|uniref:Phage tail tube protein, GTA-gp10 n=1 Tax=Roseicitreum antarcticum TaxID=564137 RepID=A0A1H2WCI3_9RHOB|nr:hypothetical protein [Roseicitreum antarcticum]SDW78332.1 hypothetical protein SAMN04488238_103339 [Roseicitreum antarcticum]